MNVAISLDEETHVVAVEFACVDGVEAASLFEVLQRQVTAGRIELGMAHADGSAPELERVQ
ncbi:MAG: hypothetical protein ACOY45_01750 [Pseudomonadota bacterium]